MVADGVGDPLPRRSRSDILRTKFSVPRIGSALVRRDQLTARLEAGLRCTLMLICAPAGYGKTTLVIDWLRSRPSEGPTAEAVAWLSLADADNDPVQFTRLLVAALRTAAPGLGESVLAGIEGSGSPLRAPFTMLINELAASPREIILVLEDYHVIRHLPIHEVVVFLLEHLPACLHVAVITREDPPFPLLKLRARGALCELRAADLQFTADEAERLLREVMGLPISAAEAAVLEARTEGWVAGLQLAALSIPAGDVSSFVAAFGRTHHHILDYLREEVFARQPPSVQTFLLRTSILDRLSGPLCQAVIGDEQPEGRAQAMLERIERSNLFLMPLDSERGWYRYHQLFADLLREHLRLTAPDLVPDLQRRASAWYEEQGFVQEAIQHALAISDHDRVVRLIEQHGMAFFNVGLAQTILGWFHALPAKTASSRPMLSIIHAYALYGVNQLEVAERRLHAAEQHLRPDRPSETSVLIEGNIALLRAFRAGARGDLAGSVALAAQAADLLPAKSTGRALARVWAGWAVLVGGDVTAESERAVSTAVELARTDGAPLAIRIGLALLAQVHLLQGRLDRASIVLAEAEKALSSHIVLGVPVYSFGRGELLRQRNDLEGAEHLLTLGIAALSEANLVMPCVVARGYITLAKVRQARSDGRGAMAALDALVTLARQRRFAASVARSVGAARAQLWLTQGRVGATGHWADTSGLSPSDKVSYASEQEYLVFARVLISRQDRAVLALLDRLLKDAEANERMGSAIEILALRALACHALGDRGPSLQDLERALALGEPEGYTRLFVDEGAPMATLLRRAHTRGIAPEYVARLLRAFGEGESDTRSLQRATASSLGDPGRPQSLDPLVRPLTGREREILGLIVEGASNGEIARRLVVTPGTVKTHVYHVFGKLGVTNRTQAIARAKALNLV